MVDGFEPPREEMVEEVQFEEAAGPSTAIEDGVLQFEDTADGSTVVFDSNSDGAAVFDR